MAPPADAAFAAVLLVGQPLATPLHERGHVAVPLALSDADGEVQLGTEPRRVATLDTLRGG